MADKIVVMNAGNVEQIGAPLELYDRPANLFVAGFIGSPAMNFLQGRVANGNFLSEDDTAWPLPPASNGAAGARLVYGIRPEHIRVAPGGIPAMVQVVEPTGSETQVIARMGARQIVCACRERIAARPGETIGLSADPALVHLFDAETGRRLDA